MHRFLTISFITLSLVISATGAAPAAHAAPGDTCTDPTGASGTYNAQNICISAVSSPASNTTLPPGSAAPTDLNPKASDGFAFAGVMSYIAQLFAWLLGVAVITLDNAVYYTVVNMGNYLHNLTAIGVAWRIMRDVGNIMLIFGFLAVGISIIVSSDWYGGGTKFLPKLLIAAVFLNFSLFISEAVIDTGNLVATQFYTQINGGPAGAKMIDTSILSSINREGISNKIMSSLGLQTIYGEVRDPKKAENLFKYSGTIGWMSIILFIIAAFVMFSLAFVLIARFVFLIYLIIVSPFRVAGFGIPMLEKASQKWLSDLLRQTFIAPVLFLLLYVALAVITDAQFLTGFSDCVAGSTAAGGCSNPSYVGFANGNFNGFASVILSFLVAMGLLLYVVYKAKDLGAVGAAGATKLAGKLTFGATAWGARNTIGLGSSFLARQARKRGISRIPVHGTNLTKALEYGARSSFDVRGAKVGGGLKTIGVEAGKAQEGGYKEELKQRVEARTKYAAELKGKEFKNLSEEQQLDMMKQENAIEKLKKQITDGAKKGTLTPENLKGLNEAVERAENELDTLHKKAGTERGAKLTYGSRLGKLAIPYIGFPTANVDAAKKIKEEARKTKDDKDLDALRKALKKSGEEKPKEEEPEEEPEKPPAA